MCVVSVTCTSLLCCVSLGFVVLICSIVVCLLQEASVRLIRELRQEIDRLKSMLLSFEMVGCSSRNHTLLNHTLLNHTL